MGTRRRMRSRRRSCGRGTSFVACAIPTGSTPGCTASSSTPAGTRSGASGDGHSRFRCSPSTSPRWRTTWASSPIATSWSAPSWSSRVEQRAALVLTHYVGLSAAEVGGILGIPVGTVYSRLHYGARAMREAIVGSAEPSMASPEAGG